MSGEWERPMKAKLFVLPAYLFLGLMTQPSSASIFPDVSNGSTFTGQFAINPTTLDTLPSSCGVCYGGNGVRPSEIGTITVQLGGSTFSGPIDVIIVTSGSDNEARWFLQSNDTVSLNGTPLFVNSAMSIDLYGSATSTSILPLTFSSYMSGAFQIEALTSDLTSGVDYFGNINSFVQVDTAANFTFSGTIASAVPEPSTWAMLILGFCGIGFMGYRRKSKPAFLAT
jgi:hypothetical protein